MAAIQELDGCHQGDVAVPETAVVVDLNKKIKEGQLYSAHIHGNRTQGHGRDRILQM